VSAGHEARHFISSRCLEFGIDTASTLNQKPFSPSSQYWTKVQYTQVLPFARVNPFSAIAVNLLLMVSMVVGRPTLLSNSKPLIVIVDDDESVCRALRRLIRSIAMDAETFSSGQDLLDLLEAMPSFCPDCLILDVQMPRMSGLAVQDNLARVGKTFPVIFITAHDDVGIREKALAAGAVAFIRKPFVDELLIRTIQEALRRGGAGN